MRAIGPYQRAEQLHRLRPAGDRGEPAGIDRDQVREGTGQIGDALSAFDNGHADASRAERGGRVLKCRPIASPAINALG